MFEAQRRGNLSDQQKQQMSRMENGLRCMDMSILKLDETLAIIRDMYLSLVCFNDSIPILFIIWYINKNNKMKTHFLDDKQQKKCDVNKSKRPIRSLLLVYFINK